MSEDIQGAARIIPKTIMLSVISNGLMGFGIALALVFCIRDIDAALLTPTGYPFIDIFYQAVRNLGGAALMTSIIVTLSLCCTVGIVASASRQLWAFSRDRAIPGWAYLQQVNA